jgi:hypothetical protein
MLDIKKVYKFLNKSAMQFILIYITDQQKINNAVFILDSFLRITLYVCACVRMVQAGAPVCMGLDSTNLISCYKRQ